MISGISSTWVGAVQTAVGPKWSQCTHGHFMGWFSVFAFPGYSCVHGPLALNAGFWKLVSGVLDSRAGVQVLSINLSWVPRE